MLRISRTFHSQFPRLSKFSLRTTESEKASLSHSHTHHHHLNHNPLLQQPKTPVRARFAPSPTGFLHLGSLRTALYNYLLAKSTNGQFLLRLEDTDQKRLVKGAEENIYETLSWLGMEIDEGPVEGGPHIPYRQSERSEIYKKYSDQLLEKGLAYRCFCSKDRLDGLRDSARMLKPPTTVSYDRHCLHHYGKNESDMKAKAGEEFTVRFISPDKYPEFEDLLHGTINHQPQTNPVDKRFEDPVLMKSDGLPTYHFANVIDDKLMEITHVVRGEEWLASTAKHISLYRAFGWKEPKFVHIPLLTTIDEKKLSKRSGDIDIMSLKEKGYLPDALINFSVLFGWSPKREFGEKSNEIFSLKELEKSWKLDGLTKGNAKVDFGKLEFFNKYYLHKKLSDFDGKFYKESLSQVYENIKKSLKIPELSILKVDQVLRSVYPSLTNLKEFNTSKYHYFFTQPYYDKEMLLSKCKLDLKKIKSIIDQLSQNSLTSESFNEVVKKITKDMPDVKKKIVFQTLRYALSGNQSGINLPVILDLLGEQEVSVRINNLKAFLD